MLSLACDSGSVSSTFLGHISAICDRSTGCEETSKELRPAFEVLFDQRIHLSGGGTILGNDGAPSLFQEQIAHKETNHRHT